MKKEQGPQEEPQATKGKAKRRGNETKEVKLCEAASNGNTTRRKHTNETKLKENKGKEVLGTRPEEKQKKSASEPKTLKSARGKPKNSQEAEVSEGSEQVEKDRRRPAGTAPKTASRAESQKKVNSEANQTTRVASQSRKKAAAEEAPPLGLRRSKRIANKK